VRPWHALALGVVLVGLGFAAAGCGGSKAPSVASIGTTTSTSSTSGARNTTSTRPSPAALAACLTSRGFPASIGSAGSGPTLHLPGVNISGNVDPHSPQFQAALKACRKLLPGGVPPSLTPAQRAEIRQHLLALAKCMRNHGVAGFPDPNGQGELNLSGVDPNSPRVEAAMKTCEPTGGFRVGRVEMP
jgi:hypothetical protein